MKVLFNTEPFKTYEKFFNVHVIEVARPTTRTKTGIEERQFPMGTNFGCFNTPQLLCIDQERVTKIAAAAPAADQTIVVVNSDKYGGAGDLIQISLLIAH